MVVLYEVEIHLESCPVIRLPLHEAESVHPWWSVDQGEEEGETVHYTDISTVLLSPSTAVGS